MRILQGLDSGRAAASRGWKALLCAAVAAVLSPAAGAADLPWVRVSPRDARFLELSNGTPWIPNGLNMVHPGGPKGQEQACMERWVTALSTNGGNFIRVWLWHSWWCPERAPGVFDEEGARRLRSLLDFCGPRGVRVKLTLDYFRDINPANPGKTWAMREAYHVSKGGPVASMKEFWDTPAGRALFVKRLDWLAERFRDRPEIFGWELWNEINAAGGGAESQIAWTRDMLAELRTRFPNHLVMQSLGSFDRTAARAGYRAYMTMPGNDLAQVHRYLDLGAQLEVCKGPMDVLAADATAELLAFDARRPVVLAEGGAVEPNHTGPFKLYAKDRDGLLLHIHRLGEIDVDHGHRRGRQRGELLVTAEGGLAELVQPGAVLLDQGPGLGEEDPLQLAHREEHEEQREAAERDEPAPTHQAGGEALAHEPLQPGEEQHEQPGDPDCAGLVVAEHEGQQGEPTPAPAEELAETERDEEAEEEAEEGPALDPGAGQGVDAGCAEQLPAGRQVQSRLEVVDLLVPADRGQIGRAHV